MIQLFVVDRGNLFWVRFNLLGGGGGLRARSLALKFSKSGGIWRYCEMAVGVLIHAVFNSSGLLDCISEGDYLIFLLVGPKCKILCLQTLAIHNIINPRRMRKGYGSRSVCLLPC